MQSFIISSRDKKKREDHIGNLLKDQKIDGFDISIVGEEGTLGISDVRQLQKKVFLKPLRGQKKAVIIKSENITTEAQNALLKILEEPPLDTIIILSIEKSNILLPTILSRCKIIELSGRDYEFSSNELSTLNFQLSFFFDGATGDRLKLASDMSKTKEEAINWVEKMIIAGREELINSTMNKKESTSQYLNILISLNNTYKILKTSNVNPRFVLENLFLSLS